MMMMMMMRSLAIKSCNCNWISRVSSSWFSMQASWLTPCSCSWWGFFFLLFFAQVDWFYIPNICLGSPGFLPHQIFGESWHAILPLMFCRDW
jgi:hypothetical protein